MHLGLFWLGTGNHSAGWRYEGAAASNCRWPVVLQGAQIAERGKFDQFLERSRYVLNKGSCAARVVTQGFRIGDLDEEPTLLAQRSRVEAN